MRTFQFVLLYVIPFIGGAQDQIFQKELLWEISHPNSSIKSYIFGTLHENNRALFQLSDSTYIAFDKAKKIVLETDIYSLFSWMDTRKELPQTRFDNDGNYFSNRLLGSKTLYGNEDGMPQFLDAYFQILAFHLNKPTIALEDVEDQYALSDQFNLTERKILNNQINSFTQEKLLELYLKGDIEALHRFMKSYLNLQEDLYEQVIVNRNYLMCDSLIALLKINESFFCAVGAGHLGGEEGILQLLRHKGFRVRPVQWKISTETSLSKSHLNESTEYIFKDLPSGLIAKFPAKPLFEQLPDSTSRIIYRELGQGNTFEILIYPYDQNSSREEIASIYINPPQGGKIIKRYQDDGTVVFQGLSDTYPEGLNMVQIQFSNNNFAVIKCYGGHKFMHSKRPTTFFEKVWFE